MVIVFLALNWFGDSLDGTVARVRNQQRPRYGFYVDHVIDLAGTACLFGGLAASGFMSPLVAALVVAGFFLVSAESFLATHARGIFKMAFAGVGPTELRLLIAAGALTLLNGPFVAVPLRRRAAPVRPRRGHRHHRDGRGVHRHVERQRSRPLPGGDTPMSHHLLQRWARFATAGLGGFIVQLGVLAVLTKWTDLHYVVATLVAVELAILCNFVWHEHWTWRDRPSATWGERGQRLARFHVLTGFTSIVGTTVVTAALVESAGLSPVVSNVIAVIALGLVNFAGSETLVFRTSAIVAVLAAGSADAATLQAKTVKDFARYASAVEARTARELTVRGPFLGVDRQPASKAEAARAQLRRGEVLIMKGSAEDENAQEIEVDGGSIHHWRGVILVPNVKLDHVLRTLKEPNHNQHKQEDVLATRVISRDGDSLKLYLRLKRTKIVTVVYDTEHDVQYQTIAPSRAASSSVATRIVEVENAGTLE